MKTELICGIAGLGYPELLGRIEKTVDAFTVGRRNNDLVNWFILKKLIDLDSGQQPLTYQEYIDEFAEVHDRLNSTQQQDLRIWPESWEWKLQVLHEHYNWMDTQSQLWNLWLPMEYAIDPQLEGQTTLLEKE